MHAVNPSNEERCTSSSEASTRSTPKNADAHQPALRLAASVDPASTPPTPPPDKRDLLIQRQALALQVIAGTLDQSSFDTALAALVGELQHRIRCDRVAVGLLQSGNIKTVAISQQATIDALSGEVRLLNDAMQEACDQDRIILHPDKEQGLSVTHAHRSLTAGRNNTQVCTIPMCHREQFIGAILFELESESPWSKLTVNLMAEVTDIVAPLIALRQKAERSVTSLAKQRVEERLELLLKPEHLGAKCASLAVLLFLIVGMTFQMTHHVKTSAEIIPVEQRLITAPQRGYISAVAVKPGDQISLGQQLLKLDTRNLELERIKQQNDLQSTRTELRSAMAAHDRKAMAIAKAKLAQTQAQLDLVDIQLNRSLLLAPFDGTVVSGDLTQSIGAPVERGETLFEIAPRDGHRITLLVRESDIGLVRIGQQGDLSIKSNPGETIRFRIHEIHPMAQATDGANNFRVDAEIEDVSFTLRPGQTGIGKIVVGESSILHVLTRDFTQWLRLRLWAWFA